MLAETAAAVSSLKGLYDIAKGMQALKTDAEVKMATSEMLNTVITVRQQVFEAQQAETALLQKIRELEDEVARLKAWDRDNESYELKRYWPGTYAYVLKAGMAGGEPPQRLCQPCYQHRKKGVLYALGNEHGYTVHLCPLCRDKFPMGGEMPGDAEP
jgi:hypothetical protein